jgi:hypothetical protein
MSTTIGSGLGGFAAGVPQPTYGAAFIPPTRTFTFKSCKMTYNTHPVQGGPYLAGGRIIDIGSARELMYLDASGSITGDVVNTGHALLLATAMGSSAIMTQIGMTTAYQLGGASGAPVGAPDKNNGGTSGCCFDMQLGVPSTDGVQHPENYHSCMIPKAEWVFDRTGLVTYSYDLDAQYLEKTTALITPTYPAAPIPFSMASAASLFKIGALGAEAAVDGVRKATVTLEHKLATDRIYLGNQYKDIPVSNALAVVTVALDFDYTAQAKTAIADLMLAGTPASIICTAVGNIIGVSSSSDTFSLNATNCFLNTGGESPLDGPDEIKNTASFTGTINATGTSALIASLISADTAW